MAASLSLFGQDVVINEVLYDPAGSDTGNEWIEIYNASSEAVNLQGWQLQKAGTSFGTVYMFDGLQLNAGEYVLIGESNVPDADITTELAFQNGGSATDGIRLVSSDGQYTDTVLYDTPNTNQLPDDITNPGASFAPDVNSGHSLARMHDGLDTNLAADDFFDCDNPTPGEANFYPVDLALGALEIAVDGSEFQLSTVIYNLSTQPVDNSAATLDLWHASTLLFTLLLPAIPPQDSIVFTHTWPVTSSGYFQFSALVNYQYDSILDNNSAMSSILLGEAQLRINEIYCRPLNDEGEWLELLNCGQCGYCVDNFTIRDASGGNITLCGTLGPGEYMVIVQDSIGFSQHFSPPESAKVYQAESWTQLNNTQEVLSLQDAWDTVFEVVEYDASDLTDGLSLERINPFLAPQPDNWTPCIPQPTPGEENSVYVAVMPVGVSFSAQPNPFSPSRGEHTMLQISLPEQLSRVTVRIYDLKGRVRRKIVNQQVLSAETELLWDGKDDAGKRLTCGVYVMHLDAVALDDEKVYSRTETVVIGK
jgi:hypothetical protein